MGYHGSKAETNSSKIFPVLHDIVDLHQSANGGAIIYSLPKGTMGHETSGSYQLIETEGYMIDYLSLCDGTHTHDQITQSLVEKINPIFGPAYANMALKTALNRGYVSLAESPQQREDIRITGTERSFQPQHLTLEIIETCNFSCDHCYYSSSPFKKGRLSLEDAKAIMTKAHNSGVRVIEITGGECTIHPDFREILQFAHDTFDLVGMISNGYKLGTNSDLLEYVASFENILVQISIDGLAKHHDMFRKHKNSFSACEAAVKGLTERGKNVRVAMSVTENNLDDIVPMFKNAKNWNVLQIVFSPVASIGRGCNVSDPGAGSAFLVKEISKRLAPFHGDPILGQKAATPEGVTHKEATNCGAGWRTFAVDYDGEVRACNYSRDSKKFGNMLSDDFDTIFGQEANYLFRNAPSPGGEACRDCKFYFNCKGCFVKAFMVSETEYPECPWRAKWFPNMTLSLDPNRKPVESVSETMAQLPQGDKSQLTACVSCLSVGEDSCH